MMLGQRYGLGTILHFWKCYDSSLVGNWNSELRKKTLKGSVTLGQNCSHVAGAYSLLCVSIDLILVSDRKQPVGVEEDSWGFEL